MQAVNVFNMVLTAQVCKDVYMERISFLPDSCKGYSKESGKNYYIFYTLGDYHGIPEDSIVHAELNVQEPSMIVMTYVQHHGNLPTIFWTDPSAKIVVVNLLN